MNTDKLTLARTIDWTIEALVKYYARESDRFAKQDELQSELYRRDNNITSTYFQLAINIMQEQGYIKFKLAQDESTIIDIYVTVKGMELYLSGGLVAKIEKEEQLHQTSIKVNKSVIRTNEIQKWSLVLTLAIGGFAAWVTFQQYSLEKERDIWELSEQLWKAQQDSQLKIITNRTKVLNDRINTLLDTSQEIK